MVLSSEIKEAGQAIREIYGTAKGLGYVLCIAKFDSYLGITDNQLA